MNWFSIYLDYCRKSDLPASELQRYLLIWDDKYSVMIRRSLSMTLKEKLEQLPQKENTSDLRALIEGIKSDTGFLRNVYTTPKKQPSKKKLTKEEKTVNLLHRITKHKR